MAADQIDRAIQWLQEDAILRRPFPPEQVGLLPKPTKKDAEKGHCNVCGKWHGLPAIHLDYVGHGAITDRLLEVDPNWSWEPFGWEDGLPKIIQRGGDLELWIRLTIGDRSKIGVGSCPANQFDASKVLIGDALRNAGMRFGMALDLWIKGEGQDDGGADAPKRQRSGMKRTPTPPEERRLVPRESPEKPQNGPPSHLTPEQAIQVATIKKDLLGRLEGDIGKAAEMWSGTLVSFGLDPEKPLPADMIGAIEHSIKALAI